MANEIESSAAGIAVDKIDHGVGFITVRPAMELAEGILPIMGGEENRKVTISSCSLVDGHIFGREVILLDCDKRSLSTRVSDLLPGTQINGGINAFEDVYIGRGSVVKGGILSGGDVKVASAVSGSSEIPSRIIIQGSICGDNVEIGDGVIVLGPVIAQESLTLGNGVTVRDYLVSPSVSIGDGCLVGGIIASNKFMSGQLNTVAASSIVLPEDNSALDIRGDIRSPYPGCNSCPHKEKLGGDDSGVDYGRRLSCHLYSKITEQDGGIQVKAGTCKAWTPFPTSNEEAHWHFSDNQMLGDKSIPFTVVSNVQKSSLNIDVDSSLTAIWEMTAEAIDK
jgi:acetyltransferase-like isoleucine patch superfamily enzyme